MSATNGRTDRIMIAHDALAHTVRTARWNIISSIWARRQIKRWNGYGVRWLPSQPTTVLSPDSVSSIRRPASVE